MYLCNGKPGPKTNNWAEVESRVGPWTRRGATEDGMNGFSLPHHLPTGLPTYLPPLALPIGLLSLYLPHSFSTGPISYPHPKGQSVVPPTRTRLSWSLNHPPNHPPNQPTNRRFETTPHCRRRRRCCCCCPVGWKSYTLPYPTCLPTSLPTPL